MSKMDAQRDARGALPGNVLSSAQADVNRLDRRPRRSQVSGSQDLGD
jgi:hypothetical protein